MMSAPIQDLAFLSRKTPKRSRRHRRMGSNSSDASVGSSVASSASSIARRRFFPNALFGGDKAAQKKMDTSPPAVSASPARKPGEAVVRSMKTWDVKMPAIKKHMISGHMVPTVRGATRLLFQKNRRLTIEIHGAPVYSMDTGQSIVSAMTPVRSGRMQELLSGGSPEQDKPLLNAKDVVLVRIMRVSYDQDDSNNGGDGDLSTLGPYAPDDVQEGHLVEHYSYRLEDVAVVRQHGRTCEMKLGTGQETVVRDLKFESEKDAMLFDECLTEMNLLLKDRAKRLAEEYRNNRRAQTPGAGFFSMDGSSSTTPDRAPKSSGSRAISMPMGDIEEGDVNIRLLIDIVGAIDLPVADLISTDAYVVVRLGSREIHKTKVISKNLNPIFTIETGSLYLLETTTEDFFASASGLTFLLRDYDAVGRDDVLGKVVLSHSELLEGNGDRVAHDIVPEKAKKTKKQGKLVLRFKEASDDDVEFMRLYKQQGGKVGIYSEETFLPPRSPDSTLLKRQIKRLNHEEFHRVKPFPNPDDPENTKWMSKAELQVEAQKESKGWTEAGSGDLGKLHVEVIGCDGLPNMDMANLNPRDKTDAFACLVFEDVVVNTDVIGDTIKPRWMPWSRRAFIFNISHAQSNLFLGIFDYDPPRGAKQLASRAVASVHDPIGRIVINLGHYLPDTVYDVTFPLYYRDEDSAKSKARGSVILRLRMEWNSPREALVRAAAPPPPMYVSCDNKINWQVVHYTVEGVTDETSFSMTVLANYVKELQSFEMLVPYAVEAALHLWLWRGHCQVSLFGRSFLLPLHSVTLFVWGALICWNLNVVPSFLVFLIGWALLAMNEYTRKNPSPWRKPLSYWELLSRAILQRDSGTSIEADQGLEAYNEYKKQMEAQRKRFEEEKQLEIDQDAALRDKFGDEIAQAEADDMNIATERTGMLSNLNPLKPMLYPIQLQLEKVMRSLRIAVSIIRWEEPFLAWWITTACFLASFVMIWIPWGFLIHWSLRVVIFLLVGPWMALYQRILARRRHQSLDEVVQKMKSGVKAQYQEVIEAASHHRARKEQAMKLKSMKKYLYGKYLVNVPRFCIEDIPSIPLPASKARPFTGVSGKSVSIIDRKYGQHLTGDMIPKREFQMEALDTTTAETSPGRFLKRFRPKNWIRRRGDGEKEPLLKKEKAAVGAGDYESIEDGEDGVAEIY